MAGVRSHRPFRSRRYRESALRSARPRCRRLAVRGLARQAQSRAGQGQHENYVGAAVERSGSHHFRHAHRARQYLRMMPARDCIRITHAKLFRAAKKTLGIRSRRAGFGAGSRWLFQEPQRVERIGRLSSPYLVCSDEIGAPAFCYPAKDQQGSWRPSVAG